MKIDLENSNELSLLQKFNNREGNAFAEVYSMFYSEIIHFISKLYHDAEISPNDVFHDIFVKIWQAKKLSFERLINVKAYIYTCIKNDFKNYIRHRKYIHKYHNDIIHDEDQFTVEIIESEIYSIISQAIGLLPAECARVLKLHLEGWDIKEIAEQLNKSERTIYNRKEEAITILRKKLNKDYFSIFLTILP